MRIDKIHICEGLFERAISFSPAVNLIHSENNSCGKTTLLRFMLYGLGYQVPNTRKIKFGNCEVQMLVFTEKYGDLTLERNTPSILQLTKDSEKCTFVLPDQEDELHAILFATDEPDVLHNLLGSFYVDQEKGWTLLNRGVVIGSIRFSIEELVRGLSGIDCKSLIEQEKELTRQISKYNQMASVAAYREQLQKEEGSLLDDSFEESVDAETDILLVEQTRLKKELRRIDSTLSDNKRVKRFISEIGLIVKAPDGQEFPVTEDNIVGLEDIIQLLIAKRKITGKKLHDINSKIESLNNERSKENEQLEFFKTVTPIEAFDKSISRMPLDAVAIRHNLERLTKQRKEIRDEISKSTSMNNTMSKEISEAIIKYATELGVGDKDSLSPAYMYTSNLKELSGAVLHKMVFAFRMAYIKAIESKLGIHLPIILDSPSGKEIDQKNITLMMNILKRDFSENQIIIASIYDYYFEDQKVIEIEDRLINSPRDFGEPLAD